MTKEQYKEQLWEEYVANCSFIEEEQKATTKEIGLLFRDDVTFLYQVYRSLSSHGGAMEDERTCVQYEILDEYRILRRGSAEIAFSEEVMMRVVADMIDIFEDILPMGSVVDLKKDFLTQKVGLGQVDQIRMIITKRFLSGERGGYYPYAALVYPLGVGKSNHNICFTSAMIEKVVRRGYSDEVEDAFVYYMKHQLIVTEERKSMGFANEVEQEEMRQLIFRGGEENGGRG